MGVNEALDDIDETTDDPEQATAWRLAEEFDRTARTSTAPPDPTLLDALADAADDDVLVALIDALGGLCAAGVQQDAERYAEHLAALAPRLGPDGRRGMLAAVDVHTAALYLQVGDQAEAARRAHRCESDLAEVIPGLLADREWVLGALADDEGRQADAHEHAVRARDRFAEYERWVEAATAAEAAAATHPMFTAEALADWRRAAKLYLTADRPGEALQCAEQACQLLGQQLMSPGAAGDPTLLALCGPARELAIEHGLAEFAARLGLAAAGHAADSGLPWDDVVHLHERARRELSTLDLDPAQLRVELARVDTSLGRAALLQQRVTDAEQLLSAAVAVFRDAGADDEVQVADGMLAALRMAQPEASAAPPIDDRFTDPAVRAGLLVAEAFQLAGQGNFAEALSRLEASAALQTTGSPQQMLLLEAMTATVRRGAGEDVDATDLLTRIDGELADPGGRLPHGARTALTQIAGMLRRQQPVAAEGLGPAPEVDDLPAAIAALHRMPSDAPDRGPRAAVLIEAILRGDPMSDVAELRPLDGLLAIADGAVPETPRWRRIRTGARLLNFQRALAENEVTDPDVALARLRTLEEEAGTDPMLQPLVGSARIVVKALDSAQNDDPGVSSGMFDEMEQLLRTLPPEHPLRSSMAQFFDAFSALKQAHDRGEDTTLLLAEAQRATAQLPPGALRTTAEESLDEMSRLLATNRDSEDQRLTDEQLDAILEGVERPSRTAGPDLAMRHALAAAEALLGGKERDPRRVDIGIDQMERALRAAGPQHPQRVFYLVGLALGLGRRFELANGTVDLRDAYDVALEARELAGGPAHPQWQQVNEMLGEFGRMLGEDPQYHRSALQGLRRHVWQVLVQPDLTGAARVARRAAADAADAARMCLVAHDPAGALSALDAGRGLALFAATAVRSIGDLLTEAGEPQLADEWRVAAEAHDPDLLSRELRRAVMNVLATHSSAAALLDPPALDEIQQALAAVDADALVYLLPSKGLVPGYAVVAPAVGAPSYLALPNLASELHPDVERYLTALSRRDAAAGGARDLGAACAPPVTDEVVTALDALSSWEWNAAMGPLIESYLAGLPTPPSGRPHRVVLVPMGDLARLPWQAARRPDGKYAIQLIAISQSPSARMLCRSASLAPVPSMPIGLLVADPDATDAAGKQPEALTSARLEAYAIHQVFYRGARYLGRRPDGSTSRLGAGTAQQVRDWLTGSAVANGALLHLACHGVIEPGPDRATAYLLLAGGARLTADELIGLLAQAPDRDIALVVLAACRTGLSINGYDEAYSLGTAFLAGGARSVLSTQWSVPDRATSLLMFMFHHFLRTAGMPPWAALRAAQLWMLDPNRRVPTEMPEPLKRQLGMRTALEQVVAWAAFVHWGQ